MDSRLSLYLSKAKKMKTIIVSVFIAMLLVYSWYHYYPEEEKRRDDIINGFVYKESSVHKYEGTQHCNVGKLINFYHSKFTLPNDTSGVIVLKTGALSALTLPEYKKLNDTTVVLAGYRQLSHGYHFLVKRQLGYVSQLGSMSFYLNDVGQIIVAPKGIEKISIEERNIFGKLNK